jgi:hypothetical protein
MELLGKSHAKGVGGWDKRKNRYAGKTVCPTAKRSLCEHGGGQESGSAPPPLPRQTSHCSPILYGILIRCLQHLPSEHQHLGLLLPSFVAMSNIYLPSRTLLAGTHSLRFSCLSHTVTLRALPALEYRLPLCEASIDSSVHVSHPPKSLLPAAPHTQSTTSPLHSSASSPPCNFTASLLTSDPVGASTTPLFPPSSDSWSSRQYAGQRYMSLCKC